MTSHPHSQPKGATPGPWSVSEVRTVEGEYMVVGGEGQGFGLIACCPEKSDAELIVRLHNQSGVQSEPVAWMAEFDGNTDATTKKSRVEDWERLGRKVTPLYASTVPSADREYEPNIAPCDDAEFGMKP